MVCQDISLSSWIRGLDGWTWLDYARLLLLEEIFALIGRQRSAFTSARTNSLRLRSSEQMRSLEASKNRLTENRWENLHSNLEFKKHLPESREMSWVTQVQVVNDCSTAVTVTLEFLLPEKAGSEQRRAIASSLGPVSPWQLCDAQWHSQEMLYHILSIVQVALHLRQYFKMSDLQCRSMEQFACASTSN